MTDGEPNAVAQPSHRRAMLNATILVAVDAFFFNQGGIALLVGLWVLLAGLPRTLLAKKYAQLRAARLRIAAIYLVAVVLVFALNALNNRIAHSRAEALIAAVKAFHATNQRYPQTLQALVPDFIERVPLAKYTFMFNSFRYLTSKEGPSLLYVQLPPFGRPMYSFARNEWTYLD